MSSKKNEVIVLFEGYSKPDDCDESSTRANCSCTLIKSKRGCNVIVDTMTPWDGQRILDALSQHDVDPEDIDWVVSTHGHSDHTGNNNLFLNAQYHIVGQTCSNSDKYLNEMPNPFLLDDEIEIIKTPGHTLTCSSVIVRDTNLGNVVAIVGDLFERFEDIDKPSVWISAGSEDGRLQSENRLLVAELADWIIPGHGGPFQVTKEIREKLRTQLQNY